MKTLTTHTKPEPEQQRVNNSSLNRELVVWNHCGFNFFFFTFEEPQHLQKCTSNGVSGLTSTGFLNGKKIGNLPKRKTILPRFKKKGLIEERESTDSTVQHHYTH